MFLPISELTKKSFVSSYKLDESKPGQRFQKGRNTHYLSASIVESATRHILYLVMWICLKIFAIKMTGLFAFVGNLKMDLSLEYVSVTEQGERVLYFLATSFWYLSSAMKYPAIQNYFAYFSLIRRGYIFGC